ncbi:hypothetical protein [Streptomyces sp. NPDC054834]
MREHLHQRTAASFLATVWFAGQHHLVEPDDWPNPCPPPSSAQSARPQDTLARLGGLGFPHAVQAAKILRHRTDLRSGR